jgi:hypothetical protein
VEQRLDQRVDHLCVDLKRTVLDDYLGALFFFVARDADRTLEPICDRPKLNIPQTHKPRLYLVDKSALVLIKILEVGLNILELVAYDACVAGALGKLV